MAKKKAAKVSPAQWERFQRHVIYWQVLLGLQDWGITCSMATEEQCKEAEADFQDNAQSCTIAWVSDDFEHHLATIYLREDVLKQGVSLSEIDKAAFNEVCHVLFAPLEYHALLGGPDMLVRQEVHRLIRVMENTFYEQQKKELE
jgi:hypothetical protein